MILVYTGPGKGKTSASVGQALRAHGQGLEVAFAQFMKRTDQAGEQLALRQMLGERFFAGGRGFFRREETRAAHREAALTVLAWAKGLIASVDMLVLDEVLYALGNGLIADEELRDLIADARRNGTHLVLSGRGLPDWLRGEADLVTSMEALKHPFTEGRAAEKGIEF
jgi:cob(I)alamin adenosyltransferase